MIGDSLNRMRDALDRMLRHPLVPGDAKIAAAHLVLILGELDTRIIELERVNDEHRRQAGKPEVPML